MPDEPWTRLAALVRERREDLHMSQRDLASAASTTDRLVSSIERAERTTYKPRTLRDISRALGWSPDSVDRILDGLDPIAVDGLLEAAPPDLQAEVAHLRAEVARLRLLVEGLPNRR